MKEDKKEILFNIRLTKQEKERVDKYLELYRNKYSIDLSITQVLRKGLLDLLNNSLID